MPPRNFRSTRHPVGSPLIPPSLRPRSRGHRSMTKTRWVLIFKQSSSSTAANLEQPRFMLYNLRQHLYLSFTKYLLLNFIEVTSTRMKFWMQCVLVFLRTVDVSRSRLLLQDLREKQERRARKLLLVRT